LEYSLITVGIVVLILWLRDLRMHSDARRYKRKVRRRSEAGSSGNDGSVSTDFNSNDASDNGGGDFGGGGSSGSWGDSGGGGDGGGGD
jgi:uncharacterized membrane protein YgcG